MRSFLLAATACLLWTSHSALAQSPASFVSAAQKVLESYVASSHLTLLTPVLIDALGEDEVSFFTFEVQDTSDLSVRAACNGCDDVDLEVFDSVTGAALGSDTEVNVTPEVTLSGVGHARKIEVSVTMSSCSDETCSIAVGVYKK